MEYGESDFTRSTCLAESGTSDWNFAIDQIKKINNPELYEEQDEEEKIQEAAEGAVEKNAQSETNRWIINKPKCKFLSAVHFNLD